MEIWHFMDKRANIENKAIIGDRAISGDMAEFYLETAWHLLKTKQSLETRYLHVLETYTYCPETRLGAFWRQGTYQTEYILETDICWNRKLNKHEHFETGYLLETALVIW